MEEVRDSDRQIEEQTKKTVRQMKQCIEKICQSLGSGPVCEDSLADALQNYYPQFSHETLSEHCLLLFQGIKEGGDWCDQLTPLSCDSSAEEQLKKALLQMKKEDRRGFLLLMYQTLSHQSGSLLPSDQMAYYESLTEESLFKNIVFVLEQESRRNASDLLDALIDSVKEEEQVQKEPFSERNYTEEEQAWILAVSAYALAASSEKKISCTTEVVQIGRQVGYLYRCASAIKKVVLGQIVPAVMTVASLCLSGFLSYHCVTLMEMSEVFLAGTGLFAAESLIPVVISSIIGSLGLVLAMAVPIVAISGAISVYNYATREETTETMQHYVSLLPKDTVSSEEIFIEQEEEAQTERRTDVWELSEDARMEVVL